MLPAKMFVELQKSFSTDMEVTDLSYVYFLLVVCQGSLDDEFTEPTDDDMVFQQLLNTFYEEK